MFDRNVQAERARATCKWQRRWAVNVRLHKLPGATNPCSAERGFRLVAHKSHEYIFNFHAQIDIHASVSMYAKIKRYA